MAFVFGSLALIVALISLWLVSTTTKKIDAIGDEFMQRVKKDQQKALVEIKAKIADLETQNHDIEEQLKSLTEGESQPTD